MVQREMDFSSRIIGSTRIISGESKAQMKLHIISYAIEYVTIRKKEHGIY
jgi:hypothetical protein